jgi:hypothetical protein
VMSDTALRAQLVRLADALQIARPKIKSPKDTGLLWCSLCDMPWPKDGKEKHHESCNAPLINAVLADPSVASALLWLAEREQVTIDTIRKKVASIYGNTVFGESQYCKGYAAGVTASLTAIDDVVKEAHQ